MVAKSFLQASVLLLFMVGPGCAGGPADPDGGAGSDARDGVSSGDADADSDLDGLDGIDADSGDDGGQFDGGDGVEDGSGDAPPDGGEAPGDDSGLVDPAGPGPHTTRTLTEQVPAGQRPDGVDIPVQVFVPEAAGPHPVVVFSHGFNLSPDLYTSYGLHLASWGYVTVLPQYPGSVFAPRVHRLLAQDLAAVIDWLQQHNATPGGPLADQLDMTRLALAGHSMGGKISLLVASQDPRPRVVLGIDPVDSAGGPFGGDPVDYPSVTPELMDEIQVPMLLLGETTNATCQGSACQACAPEDENFQQYFQHAVSPALQMEILGADHMDFLDDPNCGLTCSVCTPGSVDPDLVRRWTRRALTAFLQVELRSEQPYLTYLTGAHALAAQAEGVLEIDSKNGF